MGGGEEANRTTRDPTFPVAPATKTTFSSRGSSRAGLDSPPPNRSWSVPLNPFVAPLVVPSRFSLPLFWLPTSFVVPRFTFCEPVSCAVATSLPVPRRPKSPVPLTGASSTSSSTSFFPNRPAPSIFRALETWKDGWDRKAYVFLVYLSLHCTPMALGGPSRGTHDTPYVTAGKTTHSAKLESFGEDTTKQERTLFPIYESHSHLKKGLTMGSSASLRIHRGRMLETARNI